ncbi:asparagine synthase (glutamine-hydrolyzing) [Gillisia sp. Q332]|uniref:asparagine synthase (glutamine-hydrolyzing) n=1 Tax=Gillisia xinjiangensis TaxID=3384765 RepID=UPI00391920A7
MCGFVGYINFDSKPLNYDVLKKMTDIQSHRGPDDQGLLGFSLFKDQTASPIRGEKVIYEKFQGGIGFNRLSILDLSQNGHQPMISNCGNVIIAYNGETYNAFKYAKELKERGYKFRSTTDTEVLLNLYMEYGIEGMLKRLNGMFAFAIIDLKKKKCFVARDHFGIKPIYVYRNRQTIMFSSEVKSFTAHPEFEAQINSDNLDEYIMFRYCAHDRSLFSNVNQIPPSHYYEITEQEVKIKEYWTLLPEETEPKSFDESLNILDSTLKASIKSQLISDVKVGCQLSGGIDSSLVTTYAREFFKANMDTFSIVFDDEKYSEEEWINYVTNYTQSDSHRYQHSNHYVYENLFNATWHLDQPISIPNAFGIKRMAERAKENVTVLLSGEGADELFGGYSRFHDLSCRVNNNMDFYSKIPLVGNRLKKKYGLETSLEDFFILSSSALTLDSLKLYNKNSNIENVMQNRRQIFPKGGDILKNASIYDMRTYMVDLLNRQDKMTMAHSVENRVPFLDRDLVELVMSLPTNFLVPKTNSLKDFGNSNKFTKHILKKLAVQKYNEKFVYRNKSGFPLPMLNLFLETPMKEMIEDLLLPGIKKRDLFNYPEILKIWNKNPRHFTSADLKNLWMFFSFEVWAQLFIDQN